MNKQVKLLYHKKDYPVILGYFMKYKPMKEGVSTMVTITTSPTEEIIRQNKCQMRF